MEKVVTNTTVLIFLSKIRRLDLLNIFKSIETTEDVQKEIFEGKEISEEEKNGFKEFFKRKVKIKEVYTKMTLDLGKGEESAINLCIEKNIPYFLSDDKKARNTAELFSIKSIGSLGIILLNLKEKKIKKKEAKDLVKLLIKHSYYISIELYESILQEIDEYKEE